MTAGYLQDLIKMRARLGRQSRGDCSSSLALTIGKKKIEGRNGLLDLAKGHGWGGWDFFAGLGMCREELG